MVQAWKVEQNGVVRHRAAGHIIGWVFIRNDGWYGENGTDRMGPFVGRKYAAQAIWESLPSPLDKGVSG